MLFRRDAAAEGTPGGRPCGSSMAPTVAIVRILPLEASSSDRSRCWGSADAGRAFRCARSCASASTAAARCSDSSKFCIHEPIIRARESCPGLHKRGQSTTGRWIPVARFDCENEPPCSPAGSGSSACRTAYNTGPGQTEGGDGGGDRDTHKHTNAKRWSRAQKSHPTRTFDVLVSNWEHITAHRYTTRRRSAGYLWVYSVAGRRRTTAATSGGIAHWHAHGSSVGGPGSLLVVVVPLLHQDGVPVSRCLRCSRWLLTT